MFALLSLCHSPVHAQTKFVPLAIGAKPGSPPPQTCIDACAIIKPFVFAYPHPETWTWIIACDEPSWQSLVKHLGYESPNHYTMALTDQRDHITYVRAEAILHPALSPASEPEHIVAHELAHSHCTAGMRTRLTTWLTGG